MKRSFLLFLILFLSIIDIASAQVSNSVLASGTWYKISVPNRGVYKIDYTFLQNMGINPAQINPEKIRIYGNGGTVLPETVNNDVIDDLEQNSIYVSASGATFGTNDYILFYANGPINWSYNNNTNLFEHTQNYYEDSSYYFLNFNLGNGDRISTQTATGSATQTFTTFNDYAVIDNDSINPGTVGKIWWGNRIYNPGAGTTSMQLPLTINMGNVVNGITVETHAGGIFNSSNNIYSVSINGQLAASIPLGALMNDYSMRDGYDTKIINPSLGNLNITLNIQSSGSGYAYLDYVRLNAERQLQFSNELSFRNVASSNLGSGNNAAFQISNANNNTKVWEVTNPLHPVILNGSLSGNTYTFTAEGNQLRSFIMTDGSQYLTPTYVGSVTNQDLHGQPQASFLIITNDSFLPAANQLADYHRTRDNMTVNVATTSQIYNEFSSGGQDISAIRNYIKMFYDRASNDDEKPKNVLLFGAASYDYKNRISNNTNIVPTYQTYSSVYNGTAYSTDDFFALLENGDNISQGSPSLDIGIGRIPAFNLEEANDAVAKIMSYTDSASFGPWKNVVTFLSDNWDWDKGWTFSHSAQSEQLAEQLKDLNPIYNQVKLFGDAFPLQNTPSGAKMVAQTKALNDQMFLGTLLVNYTGHGGPKQLAQEELVTETNINSWNNSTKLPVFVTATCDFGRFDNPAERSGGAEIMMKRNGGSIASVTTTQLVYPGDNLLFNKAYMKSQFTKKTDGTWRTLGEAVKDAKNNSGGAMTNNQKYALLGDPALTLALPKYLVRTDSFLLPNGNVSDTINALGQYVLKGSITDAQNNTLTTFNGKVYVTIYDKPQEIIIQSAHIPPDLPQYPSQSTVIYKGNAEVKEGKFQINLIVPKDINYDFGKGKISYYADNGQIDASGIDTNIIVGGYSDNATIDNDGPDVQAFIDNDQFHDGGVTGPDPLLFVKLYDDNGINITGSSVGHDLIAILDGDVAHPFVLNNYYQTAENDYKNGTVSFPMANLAPGEHTVLVRAWDTYNNSGEGLVHFRVVTKDTGAISEVYNYPNPFTQQTTFVIQHNLSKEDLTITIKIFNAAGFCVRNLSAAQTTTGNRTTIVWNGESDNGFALSSGVYYYRVEIKNKTGIKATAQQKLVLIR